MSIEGGSGDDTVNTTVPVTAHGDLKVELGGGTNNLTMSAGVTVDKTVSIKTGDGVDNVDVGVLNADKLEINLGNGANTLGSTTVTLASSLTYKGGNDNDSVNLNAFTQSAKIELGNGTNDLTIPQLARNVAFQRANLEVKGGNGTDTLSLSTVFAGDLKINLGDGANTVDLTAVDASKVRYEGGNGVDDVEVDNGTFLEVFGRFGGGNDIVDLNTVTISDLIDVDGGAGVDTLNQVAVTLPANPAKIKIVSFP
jgi:hypothetical protein